jgi:hypothetical protein
MCGATFTMKLTPAEKKIIKDALIDAAIDAMERRREDAAPTSSNEEMKFAAECIQSLKMWLARAP